MIGVLDPLPPPLNHHKNNTEHVLTILPTTIKTYNRISTQILFERVARGWFDPLVTAQSRWKLLGIERPTQEYQPCTLSTILWLEHVILFIL